MRIERDMRVPMRDGVHLSANVFRPSGGGRFPVVLQRMPYGASGYPECEFWVRRGYAFMSQDCRGRYDSEGTFYPFLQDAEDGYDTLTWIAKQDWCDGTIGMYGLSYWGAVQWLVAPLRHPNLKAISPSVICGDYWKRSYWCDGAFSLALSALWLCLEVSARTSDLNLIPAYDLKDFFLHLPLIDLDEHAGRRSRFWRDYLTHSEDSEFWRRISVRHRHESIDTPAFLMGGWYDYYAGEAFTDFVGLRALGKKAKILMGPWSHIISCSTGVGELDFGPHSMIEVREPLWRWYEELLRGRKNGILDEPPVTIFVMGINQWRDENEWPLARTRFTPYYLHSRGAAHEGTQGGSLSTTMPGIEPPDQYRYDPNDPVWTLGGNHSICWGEAYHVIQPGPFDQRTVEERADVLAYTSAVLEEDVEVTGPVTVVLYAATSARDTDFVARLVDVHPDGRAMNITEGIIRARFRESVHRPPKLLEPGAVYEFRIELQPTSNVFRKGHCLRLDITSSCFPLWDRNPNTGHAQGMDAELRVADQTVYHNAAHPSHILMPVIPAGSTAERV